ncbi:hypothetical protein Btru_001146 [Bulinus truncatus]|nr:hypothetical protein Btru_001146 [Bulinus truncatus]
MDLSQLKLYSLQPYHSGYYVCLAENSAGQDMALILAKVSLGASAAEQPRNVKVFAVNSTAINVTWEQPVPATTYVLNHNSAEATTPPQQTICTGIKGRHQFCEIGGLTPFTNYSVAITAFIKSGASLRTNPEYVRTLEDVPIAVPTVTLKSPKHYSLLVSWAPLTLSQSRGIVTSYKVYHRLAGNIGEFSKDVSADQTVFLIDGLEPGETYEVLVLAATKAGFPNIDHQKWTSFTLPPSNDTSPPMLTINFVNLSSVLLEWQDPRQEPVIGYFLELLSQNSVIDQVNLPASTHLHPITGLDSKQQYRVKLVAETSLGLSAPATLEFIVEKLADELVPKNLKAVNITADSVALEWSKLPGINIVYEICFSSEQDKSSESCQQSKENSLVISELAPYQRYEFKVRPLISDDRGDFSHLIVQTNEEKSSPPVNVTVEALKASTVSLTWLPPTEPHGDITSYVVLYGKETLNPSDFTWKTITLESTSVIQNAYSYKVEDLEPGTYLFKLAAVNGAGQGMSSDNQSVEIKCYDTISFCQTQPTDVSPEQNIPVNNGGSITFIVGIIVGILILAILIFVIVYCWRNRSTSRALDPNLNHSPICRGNGHITSPSNPSGHKPGNGHVHLTLGNSAGDYCNETINSPESTPMLQKLPENEQSDSKGPPDMVIPNGLRSNGITKANYKAPGQPTISHTCDLNISNNSELLMAAMLMTSDGSDALASSVEMTPISALDDIDRGDDESGDHSSEDSGTGCRRAGMPCAELNINGSSPASSPGGSSLHRHRYWEKGRPGDEFGGVFIDSSTGAAIKLIGAGAVEGHTGGDGFDDGAANDRDSGHGSEAKSHIGILSGGGDSVNNSEALISDLPVSAGSIELPATKQSKDDLHQQPAATIAIPLQHDSPQLPSVSSRNVINHARPQHNYRQHRGVRPHISHSDLPPPPPPPHYSSAALPQPQGLQAAVTATTTAATTTAAPVELNSSGSIDEGGQILSNGLGSILNRQLEGKTAVAFCPPRPPPSPPHIA